MIHSQFVILLTIILQYHNPMTRKKTFTLLLLILFAISAIQGQQTAIDDLSAAYAPRKTQSKYNGLLGFVLGPILFVLSFVGIWFNEKRAAVNYKRLKLAQKLLQQSTAPQEYNLDSLHSQLNSQKRLVHQVGQSQILQPARDDQCLVFPQDAIVIDRKVEVKEMRAQTKRRSGEDEIQYHLQWVSENIEQCQAESNSPLRWFVQTQKFYAPRVRVNNYFLNQGQMDKLQCDTEINPSPETISALSQLALATHNPGQPIVFNNYVYYPASNGDVQSRGTLRIKFLYCKSTQLSLICTTDQNTQTYEPFRIDLVDNNGHEDGHACQQAQCCICCEKLAEALKPMSTIDLITKGVYDSHQMIALSVKKNLTQTNLLRLLFYCIMVLGIWIFFNPFVTILGYIPLVGGFLAGTAGIVIFLAALLVCIPLFMITFGLAWLRYHPMIGGAVLGVAFAIMIAFSMTKH